MQLPYFAEVHSSFRSVVQFITNHQATQALWRQRSEHSLLKPGDTRFASAFIMLERCLLVKAKLRQLVVSDEWQAVVDRMKPSDREAAAAVGDTVSSETMWSKAQKVGCC